MHGDVDIRRGRGRGEAGLGAGGNGATVGSERLCWRGSGLAAADVGQGGGFPRELGPGGCERGTEGDRDRGVGEAEHPEGGQASLETEVDGKRPG